jgi:prepilin-type N-terminal cleavage/methylation domain-containing protein
MRINTNTSKRAFTLPEVMVAAVVVTLFFISLFELNAMCLRCIDSSKESLAAIQSVQDRSEVLRNLTFTDLTSSAYVRNLMATVANAAPFCQKATETVSISKYPTPSGVSKFTRSPNGTVSINTVATDFGDIVKIDVSVSWTMTVGARSRTEQTSSIVSNGTKK